MVCYRNGHYQEHTYYHNDFAKWNPERRRENVRKWENRNRYRIRHKLKKHDKVECEHCHIILESQFMTNHQKSGLCEHIQNKK